MIANRDFGNPRANFLDNPGAFMAKNCGKRRRKILVSDNNISVTNTDASNSYQHLIVSRLVDTDAFDLERSTLCANDRSIEIHDLAPPRRDMA